MIKIITLYFLLISNGLIGFSCDCFWGGDFFKLSKKSDVIVKVQIIGHEKINGDFNEILIAKVITVYKGELLMSDTIKLRGDNGMYCSPYVSNFKKDDFYILQFKNSNDQTPWLSNCGEYYLKLKDKFVFSEKGIRKDLPQIGEMDMIYFELSLRKSLSNTY